MNEMDAKRVVDQGGQAYSQKNLRKRAIDLQLFIALKRFAFLGLIWLALTGGDPGDFLVGLVVTAAGTWLSLRLLPPGERGVSLIALARKFPVFVWRSVLGGVDVAWRALHPRMPLKPGWVVVPTALPEGGARVALGGEFSLLPGTLVAGSRENELLIHCLDTDQEIESAVRREEEDIAASIGLRLERARSGDEVSP
jgi:multicomponent Na+:H+ antiporter subunit E